jgi:ketosteroid isomerase-like protein
LRRALVCQEGRRLRRALAGGVAPEHHGGVPVTPPTMEELAAQVRGALESGDLSAFAELLDPDVTWGAPDARVPACRNRDQVLAWYQQGRKSGTRASVNDVTVLGDTILVALVVRASPAARRRGGAALRWQVLTVRNGRVVDIVGFDDRSEALARAGSGHS